VHAILRWAVFIGDATTFGQRKHSLASVIHAISGDASGFGLPPIALVVFFRAIWLLGSRNESQTERNQDRNFLFVGLTPIHLFCMEMSIVVSFG
jgi:hypothetical protein